MYISFVHVLVINTSYTIIRVIIMEVKTNDIIRQYYDNKELYEELKGDLEDILTSILKRNSFKISNMSIRIKREDTLKRKIIYKNKYKDIKQITDIVAARIIVLFENDIDRLYECIKSNFDVVEYNDKRKKNYDDRIDFGYNSLHLLLKFTDTRCQLVEYSKYKDIVFELQIRTIVQHSWAEIEHGLGYKSQYEIPKDIRRRLTRISATLELLDEEFVAIKKELEDYNNGIEHIEKVMKTDINVHSLIQYRHNSKELNHIFDYIVNKYQLKVYEDQRLISELRLVKRFHVLGYSTIQELNQFILEYQEDIKSIADSLLEYLAIDSINYYNIYVWISLVLLAKDGLNDPENVLENELIKRIKGE